MWRVVGSGVLFTLLFSGRSQAEPPPQIITAHVTVALCDAVHQGVVAPANRAQCKGDDPERNLYWGALYGTRTHLLKNGYRKVAHLGDVPPGVLERVVLEKWLESRGQRVVLRVVADAWHGEKIREATHAFLEAAAGHGEDLVRLSNGETLVVGGQADLVAYVGHDGLMDFSLSTPPQKDDARPKPKSMVLACYSGDYFIPHFERSGATPWLWTTGLMAPEGYVLMAALESAAKGGQSKDLRAAAAEAYARYQKIPLGPARRLFALPAKR